MVNKYIGLLKKQLSKLEPDDFDLEAWKRSTVALLVQIYGIGDIKTQQIEALRIDYGSWALRDASGSYKPLESCKNQGREILSFAIDTLGNIGIPESSTNEAVNTILAILEDELKGAQFKQLKKILDSNDSEEKKNKALVKTITAWQPTANAIILAKIVTLLNLHK